MVGKKPFDSGRRINALNRHGNAESKAINHPKHCMESHHRIFGDTGSTYVLPKTSTQELLDSIKNVKSASYTVARYLINFMSYPLNDERINREHTLQYPPETTYVEKFKFNASVIEKDCCDKVLDPLFNRRPKNDFEMLPSSTNKFMDDHLIMISKERKKINSFRQLRDSSNPFNI